MDPQGQHLADSAIQVLDLLCRQRVSLAFRMDAGGEQGLDRAIPDRSNTSQMFPTDLPGLTGKDTRCERCSSRRDMDAGKPSIVVGGVAWTS